MKPKPFADGAIPKWGDGVLFVGDKGMLLSDYGRHILLPEEKFKDFKAPDPFIPKSRGHHEEWIHGIKHRTPTSCNFAYGGALSETVLLGNAAYRAGCALEWDEALGKVTNTSAADPFLRRAYRKGWSL